LAAPAIVAAALEVQLRTRNRLLFPPMLRVAVVFKVSPFWTMLKTCRWAGCWLKLAATQQPTQRLVVRATLTSALARNVAQVNSRRRAASPASTTTLIACRNAARSFTSKVAMAAPTDSAPEPPVWTAAVAIKEEEDNYSYSGGEIVDKICHHRFAHE